MINAPYFVLKNATDAKKMKKELKIRRIRERGLKKDIKSCRVYKKYQQNIEK